jgi:hypothetical protein
MKTIVTFFFAVLFFSWLSLQAADYEYVPTVREGVEWGYYVSQAYYSQKPNTYYRVCFKGDTPINNMSYKKCYCYRTCTFDSDSAKVISFMREENKRVYMRPNPNVTNDFMNNIETLYYDNDKEYCLYDFNYNVGDTIKAIYALNGNVVTEIDSVLVNGKLRKLFKSGNFRTFMEGIGPIDENGGDIMFPFPAQLTGGAQIATQFNYEHAIGKNYADYRADAPDNNDPCFIILGVSPVSENFSTMELVQSGSILTVTLPTNDFGGIELIDISGRVMGQ